jgi:hypothetical protein
LESLLADEFAEEFAFLSGLNGLGFANCFEGLQAWGRVASFLNFRRRLKMTTTALEQAASCSKTSD